ncbi:hypothetical protein cand_021170 [Cryptosporidium andersoni]|uniref:Uncharacterized protein n=1 Tax=Cryptosporidium andersoni TaxID=117008 RepID=A0A1J4MST5_9CRYT|nr:hypothetical protein cand_021170 [Cryptosporidium andersoni]
MVPVKYSNLHNILKLLKILCIYDIIEFYLKTRRENIKCISDKRTGFEFVKITQLGQLENIYLGINYSKLYGIKHLLRLISNLKLIFPTSYIEII